MLIQVTLPLVVMSRPLMVVVMEYRATDKELKQLVMSGITFSFFPHGPGILLTIV